VTRQTIASELVGRPAIMNAVDCGVPPTGTAADGAVCCPTT
jgi:hypothetical protein